MARAFLKLYAVTADRKWLRRAEEAAQFVETKFKSDIGYIAFVQPLAGKLKPKPQVDENAAVARTLNLLHHYTGKEIYEKAAQHAMRYLAAPAIGENHGYAVAGILLADKELGAPPLHVTVVGKKDDPAARSLFHGGDRSAGELQARRVVGRARRRNAESRCAISNVRESGGVHLRGSQVLSADF